ncbi:MAG: metabolite traffic protein EboE [Cyanobacteria bacterium J06607_10]
MQLPTDSLVHLTYCTNIHPGESWPQVFTNLHTHTVKLKQRLCPDRPFGTGLRLSNAASLALTPERLQAFYSWLQQQGLYVFTINGFPYGGFHHQVVKDKVYAPDWTRIERLHYTLRLTEILAVLLPEGMDGGISTLPLSYKPWHTKTSKSSLDQVFIRSTQQIVQVVIKMAQIFQDTGKLLHLDIEPEPDGLVENTREMIAFFKRWLIPLGAGLLAEAGFSRPEVLLRRHVQVCYDACHFAVEYIDPAEAIAQFHNADIRIGKLQLSAAIKTPLPAVTNRKERTELLAHLTPFAESTYLHQVIARGADDQLVRYRDLAAALPYMNSTTAREWRIHFHVPIFLSAYQAIASTQDHLAKILSLLPQTGCRHLEIETYTWDVLPEDLALDVLSAIEREYRWVLETLAVPLSHTKSK